MMLMTQKSQEMKKVNLFLTQNQKWYFMSILANTQTKEFEVKGIIKYLAIEKNLDDVLSQSVDAHPKNHNLTPYKCNLGITKEKQLQQQDSHIIEIVMQGKSKKWEKTPSCPLCSKYYYLNSGMWYY